MIGWTTCQSDLKAGLTRSGPALLLEDRLATCPAVPTQREMFSRSQISEWLPRRQYTHEDLYRRIQDMAKGGGCFPRVQWFAEQFGVCVRTIQRWLGKLGDRVIRIIRGWHRSNRYKLKSVTPSVTPDAPHLYYSIPSGGFYSKQPAEKPLSREPRRKPTQTVLEKYYAYLAAKGKTA